MDKLHLEQSEIGLHWIKSIKIKVPNNNYPRVFRQHLKMTSFKGISILTR